MFLFFSFVYQYSVVIQRINRTSQALSVGFVKLHFIDKALTISLVLLRNSELVFCLPFITFIFWFQISHKQKLLRFLNSSDLTYVLIFYRHNHCVILFTTTKDGYCQSVLKKAPLIMQKIRVSTGIYKRYCLSFSQEK